MGRPKGRMGGALVRARDKESQQKHMNLLHCNQMNSFGGALRMTVY